MEEVQEDARKSVELICEFSVSGKPASRGSKRPVRHKHTGRIMLIDSCKRSYGYMADIKAAAIEAMAGKSPLECPVMLFVQFRFQRPKSHFNKKGLKADAPDFHTQVPDLSKAIRGVEDAMTGVVYKDDRQIVGYANGNGKVWTESESSTLVQVWALR